MKHKSLSFAIAVSLFSSVTIRAEDPQPRPSVLFIAIDDLNDWVGFLGGHPQALTPNMDRLANRGIVFTNAHCASPACNPSRAAVFSGKMPWRTNVWSNSSKKLFAQHSDIRVLPDSFRDAGYATLGTGKLMHSGANANKRLFEYHHGVEQRWSPLTREQARYTQQELPTKGTDKPRHFVDLDGQQIILPLNRMPSDRNPGEDDGESFDWGPFDFPDSAMGDAQITDWAIGQLESRLSEKDQPFFMGVGYYRPHIPLWAPAKYFDRFENAPAKLPPFETDDLDDLGDAATQWALEPITAGTHATVVKYGQWEQAVEAYLACTTFVDAQIGRLLDALDAGGFGENTIVVLWSDHGWHLGEKQHWGKWTGWERSTRVPLVIVPPKRLEKQFAKPSSRCAKPVSLMDLYPTLLELCDLKGREGLDGKSLVPLLRRPESKSQRAVVTVFSKGNISVRDDRWRFIRYSDGSQELYDLENDPNEWTNLAGDLRYEKHVKELSREIPAESLPKAEQFEFNRLRSRVRRFKIDETYDESTPILFATDFKSGDFDRLSISEDDHYSIAAPLPERLQIVDAPAMRTGKKAARFSVPYSGGAFRSELSLVHEQGFNERWYSGRIFIPKDWKDELGSGGDIVMQWHAIPGNWRATFPNLALSVRSGEWHLRRSYGSPQTKPTRQSMRLGKVAKGQWTDWVFHVKWSPQEDGLIEIWRNGERVVEQPGPNVYGTIGIEYTPYMKFGLYHPEWKSNVEVARENKVQHRSVYITDVVVGNQLADIESISGIFD